MSSCASRPPATAWRTAADAPPRILSQQETDRIVGRVRGFAAGGGDTIVTITSWWSGELRWARNRVSLSGDRRNINVHVSRWFDGGGGSEGSTNQSDDESLRSLVHVVERAAGLNNGRVRRLGTKPWSPTGLPMSATTVWSDATYNVTSEQQSELARALVMNAEPKGMLSAGYLEMHAGEVASHDPAGRFNPPGPVADAIYYQTYTQAQCSMTVRHPKGVGSGWAGLSGYDWATIDAKGLSERALEKCIASLNPVAIEPGRYTAILEPQAVRDLLIVLYDTKAFWREQQEGGTAAPFALGQDNALKLMRTKLGLKVADERITISHDPFDPRLGILPMPGLAPVTWIDRGVLKTLSYDRRYATVSLHDERPDWPRTAFRVSGGETTPEEMIATTKRGLLVTRFSNVSVLDMASVLATGVTRDGLWLVENGKISKAVKNMRITESPLFVLNQIEQLGVPVPVFQPVTDPASASLTPAIVPPLKVKDFSFTAMVDAV